MESSFCQVNNHENSMQLTQNKRLMPFLIAEIRAFFRTPSPFLDTPHPSRFKRATLKLENPLSLVKPITSKFLIDNFKHFSGCYQRGKSSETRQNDPLLRLVFPLFVLVRDFAKLVRLEENHLAQSFIRINSRRQRRGVADFQRHEPLPLRLERRHVDDDPAPRIRRFAYANRQH